LLSFGAESFVFQLPIESIKNKTCRTVVLSCLLWEGNVVSELREKHRLRVFENTALRKIFGPKNDEVTGNWRRLHNEELHSLYCTPDAVRVLKSRRMRRAEHVARVVEKGSGGDPGPLGLGLL
jgi:hypothetical protein